MVSCRICEKVAIAQLVYSMRMNERLLSCNKRVAFSYSISITARYCVLRVLIKSRTQQIVLLGQQTLDRESSLAPPRRRTLKLKYNDIRVYKHIHRTLSGALTSYQLERGEVERAFENGGLGCKETESHGRVASRVQTSRTARPGSDDFVASQISRLALKCATFSRPHKPGG
jgi:hypothetical protein